MADLHQPGLGEPLERLAHRRSGDAQQLGEPSFAGQGIARVQLAPDHLLEQLVEHVVVHQPTFHRFQGHPATLLPVRQVVKWSDQYVDGQ